MDPPPGVLPEFAPLSPLSRAPRPAADVLRRQQHAPRGGAALAGRAVLRQQAPRLPGAFGIGTPAGTHCGSMFELIWRQKTLAALVGRVVGHLLFLPGLCSKISAFFLTIYNYKLSCKSLFCDFQKKYVLPPGSCPFAFSFVPCGPRRCPLRLLPAITQFQVILYLDADIILKANIFRLIPGRASVGPRHEWCCSNPSFADRFPPSKNTEVLVLTLLFLSVRVPSLHFCGCSSALI